MQVKVLPGHSVILPGKTAMPGDVVSVSAADGKRLIDKGLAVAVADPDDTKNDGTKAKTAASAKKGKDT